jgi:hypothetical protein
MEQITLKVEEVIPYIEERIKFWFFFLSIFVIIFVKCYLMYCKRNKIKLYYYYR